MGRRLPVGGRWNAALIGVALAMAAPAAATAPPEPGMFDRLFGSDPAAERAGKASDGLALPDLFADGQRIGEALPMVDLGPGGDRCVAVTALLDALELAHQTTADGDISITLPEPRRTVMLPGAALHPGPGGACLPLAAVSAHLPLGLAYEAESQRLLATANAPLPVLMRLARAQRQARLRPETIRPAFPFAPRPTGLARLWSADVAVTMVAAPGGNDTAGTVLAAGELLGLGARISLGLAARAAPVFGLALSDASEAASLLGPLRARSLNLGDVNSPAQPLVADTLAGRGLVISSRPPWRADLVDEIVLSGPLQPGWEAELWHEDRLVAATRTADASGQWQFARLPVRLGGNRWTVKLYGPHGEVEEQQFNRNVGSAMNAENEIDYTIGFVDGGSPVVGAAPNRMASGAAAFASLGWGVTPGLTGRLDLRAPLAASPALGLGLRGAMGRMLWAASMARDTLGGTGFGFRLARRMGAQDLVLDIARHGRDAGPAQMPVVREFGSLAAMTAQGRVPLGRLSLPWQMRFQSGSRRGGGVQNALATRIALPLSSWQASAAIGVVRQAGSSWQGNAGLGFAAGFGRWRLRGAVDAALAEQWQIGAITISAGHAGKAGTVSLDLGWQPDRRSINGGVSVNRRLGPFGLSANLGRGADGWRAGMGLVVGLWQGHGRWHAAAAGLARSGAILADLFIDEDGDGQHGPEEPGIKGGRFIAAAALRADSTDASGQSLLRALPAGPSFDLETQLASIEDFSLRPATPGDRLALRPGEVRTLSIPMRRTGSIEVLVRLAAGDARTPRSGMPVTLHDRQGREVAHQLTDFEGYALFDGIALERWQVEASGQRTPAIDLTVERSERSVTIDVPANED